MTQPTQPLFLEEGPPHPCTINGKNLTWTQCTPLSTSMLIDRSTLGAKRPDPCTFRKQTGDTSGGTTLPQCAAVAKNNYGVTMEVHTGSNVCTPYYFAYQLALGRGAVLQGNTSAIGKGNVNHAIEANQAKGTWTTDGKTFACSGVYIYDPWSKGPAWWSWDKVKAFAAALRPWGEFDSRTLGPGKMYAMFGPDTEPHVHLHFNGSRQTVPFPDQQVIRSPAAGRKVNVRTGPGTNYPVVMALESGTRWNSYQVTDNGQVLAGSGRWWGNHDGNRWIHNSGLTGQGGMS